LNTTPPVRVERRVGQRFSFLIPFSVRQVATGVGGSGFTQDLSSRGVFFYTDLPLEEGAEVEITLKMPSEITLGESMPVRCRGRVLRVAKPAATLLDSAPGLGAETKVGVAVRLDGYEYLPEPKDFSFGDARVSVLHSQHESDEDAQQERRPREDERPVFVAAPRS